MTGSGWGGETFEDADRAEAFAAARVEKYWEDRETAADREIDAAASAALLAHPDEERVEFTYAWRNGVGCPDGPGRVCGAVGGRAAQGRSGAMTRIFGWSITRTNRPGPAARRAARNDAAMTSSIGAPVLPGEPVAARIHREEIPLAEAIIREAHHNQWRLTGTERGEYGTRVDYRPDEFAAILRQRLGAAAAVEADPAFAPTLAEEITLVEQALTVLHAWLYNDRQQLGPRGRMLVTDLHTRMGHAEAIQHLGNTIAFRTP